MSHLLVPCEHDDDLRVLIKEPEGSKTIRMVLSHEDTVASVVHRFLKKRSNSLLHACQLVLLNGSVDLTKQLSTPIFAVLGSNRSILTTKWKTSAGGCVDSQCERCLLIKTALKSTSIQAGSALPRLPLAPSGSTSCSLQEAPSFDHYVRKDCAQGSVLKHVESVVASLVMAADLPGQIERLVKLREGGDLTAEEFQTAKCRILYD
ncbi:MAG: uncharacterized protein KVP18_002362 [Porospora cf. gigantea A]|uniref:uncharacterized protein n=1 Tax=Porospora cf. gigantea A TaxID=2853593 RepID=UPI00355A1D4C|nr:MAG: hypothetical protein KVP18_002362 [Porospora cf. gigantea A]